MSLYTQVTWPQIFSVVGVVGSTLVIAKATGFQIQPHTELITTKNDSKISQFNK